MWHWNTIWPKSNDISCRNHLRNYKIVNFILNFKTKWTNDLEQILRWIISLHFYLDYNCTIYNFLSFFFVVFKLIESINILYNKVTEYMYIIYTLWCNITYYMMYISIKSILIFFMGKLITNQIMFTYAKVKN